MFVLCVCVVVYSKTDETRSQLSSDQSFALGDGDEATRLMINLLRFRNCGIFPSDICPKPVHASYALTNGTLGRLIRGFNARLFLRLLLVDVSKAITLVSCLKKIHLNKNFEVVYLHFCLKQVDKQTMLD